MPILPIYLHGAKNVSGRQIHIGYDGEREEWWIERDWPDRRELGPSDDPRLCGQPGDIIAYIRDKLLSRLQAEEQNFREREIQRAKETLTAAGYTYAWSSTR